MLKMQEFIQKYRIYIHIKYYKYYNMRIKRRIKMFLCELKEICIDADRFKWGGGDAKLYVENVRRI